MHANILVFNAGSSSLKFALYRSGSEQDRIAAGVVERIGQPDTQLKIKEPASRHAAARAVSAPDHASCIGVVLETIEAVAKENPVTHAAHRIVHGGPRHFAPERITAELLDDLRRLSPFDPEHLPSEIALIEALGQRCPEVPQVACFDTAFHRDLPRLARMLPLPRRYEAAGIRRYGFHGLSYAFQMEELLRLGDPAATKGRVVLAHLGNGASMAAVCDGRCIDTSMGFTPTAGLVMGTRSGDLDPGVASYLAIAEKMNAPAFQKLVNHESGMLGISETSSDMRTLLAAESHDSRAAEAVGLFCYQAKKWLGSYTAALGGLDTLVFAGGIGENCPPIRARICDSLQFLGLSLDQKRNDENAPLISAADSRVSVRVIRTDEERMIARSAARVFEAREEEQPKRDRSESF